MQLHHVDAVCELLQPMIAALTLLATPFLDHLALNSPYVHGVDTQTVQVRSIGSLRLGSSSLKLIGQHVQPINANTHAADSVLLHLSHNGLPQLITRPQRQWLLAP
jgi:hypothetical protein